MLSKLSVPGRPTSLDDSRARAYWVESNRRKSSCYNILMIETQTKGYPTMRQITIQYYNY